MNDDPTISGTDIDDDDIALEGDELDVLTSGAAVILAGSAVRDLPHQTLPGTAAKGRRPADRHSTMPAWQRIERLREDVWLKKQLEEVF